MASRSAARAIVLPRAALYRAATLGRRSPPANPQRILICHHLLLGDTIMLTPLLAKLRHRYASAELVMTMPNAYVELYSGKPYGVVAKNFDPRSGAEVRRLMRDAGFDLALVPGDNRFSWTAAALHSRWIIALANDRPAYKSWPVDEYREWPSEPTTLEDIFQSLVQGPPPPEYRKEHWPAPTTGGLSIPNCPYAVLHVGAGSALRLWEPEKWRALAQWIEQTHGLEVIWSAGPKEEALVKAVDPSATRLSLAGRLSLPQLWRLLSSAQLVVCPDTGVSHIAKAVCAPTIVLFGPGSRTLFGPSAFWGDIPWRGVTVDPFTCRDQQTLFKRRLPWVRRCQRSIQECPAPRCMQAISVDDVQQVAATLLTKKNQRTAAAIRH